VSQLSRKCGSLDVTSTALRREEMEVCLWAIQKNSLMEGAMWHVDPLLGNDHEISNHITAADK
jgi:hypothetical protein